MTDSLTPPLRPILFDLEELAGVLPRDDRAIIPKSFPTDDMEVLTNPALLNLAMKIAGAYALRMRDALSLYRPLPGDAEKFHASRARIRLVNGSNQAGKCLRNDQPVFTPTGWKLIGELVEGDEVIGGDGKTCKVLGVYPQGKKKVLRVTFCDGASTVCSEDHLWKVKEPNKRFGKHRKAENWTVKSLSEIRKIDGDSPRPAYRVAIPTAVTEFKSQNTKLDPYLMGALLGKRSWKKHVPREYLFNSVEVRIAVLRGLMDTDGTVDDRRGRNTGGHIEFCTTSPLLAKDVEFLVRSLGGKCKTVWRVTSFTYKGIKKNGRPSARVRVRLPGFNPFLLKRKADLYKAPVSTSDYRILHKIEPEGEADCTCIAVDNADHTYITRDFIVTHNTNLTEVEWARIGRGLDPFNKRKKSDLRMMAVGKDARHLGQVMWRKLYLTGAFDCIKDLETGMIRSVMVDPTDLSRILPSDLARKSEWIPSPPMIPEHVIETMTWESAGEGVPKIVILKNKTEMLWCTSNGSPPAGIQLDVAHFDEELTNDRWLPETLPRLMRRGGIFFWSATPQSSTPQFYDLHRRCEAGDPDIEEFTLLVENNPYLPAEAKEAFRRDCLALGDEEYQVRWRGKYAIQGREVYPTYDKSMLVSIGQVPSSWMKIVALDPGTAVSAFVVLAVPPEADCVYVVDECELRNKDARGLAKELKHYLQGERPEAYIIDKQGGDQTSMGRNDTVAEHYMKEMIAVGVPPSNLAGHGFIWGCNVPAARELSVKGLMNSGRMKFREGHTLRLDKQIKGRYYDKANMDRREKRTVHDVCDAWEYGGAFFDEGIYYTEPLTPILNTSAYDERIYRSLMKKKRR